MRPRLKELMSAITQDFDVSITTGYAGYLASGMIYSSPNYISAINETVAVDFAHIFSYLGKRSLVIMKNAGLNESFLPIVNSCILGTNAGMVLWIVDDLKVEGSEICQDSKELIRLLGIKPNVPKSWEELYAMTKEAYIASEKMNLPQAIIISNELFKSRFKFKRDKLSNENSKLNKKLILHPKTANSFMIKFNKNKQIKTKMFPVFKEQNFSHNKLISIKYKKLFSLVSKLNFNLIIGDFGTYTLAKGSIVEYGLHYGAAVASGIGASLAGKEPLVFVGEGGFTAGFEAVLELVRKDVNVKIILIENGGISGEESLHLDLVKICKGLKIRATRIKEKELSKLSSLLKGQGSCVVAIDFSR